MNEVKPDFVAERCHGCRKNLAEHRGFCGECWRASQSAGHFDDLVRNQHFRIGDIERIKAAVEILKLGHTPGMHIWKYPSDNLNMRNHLVKVVEEMNKRDQFVVVMPNDIETNQDHTGFAGLYKDAVAFLSTQFQGKQA